MRRRLIPWLRVAKAATRATIRTLPTPFEIIPRHVRVIRSGFKRPYWGSLR